jgi:hypothetical protein
MDLSPANITYRAHRSPGPAWRDRALLNHAAGGGAGGSGLWAEVCEGSSWVS